MIEIKQEPRCNVCYDTGKYCTGASGSESDGNALEFEDCDCSVTWTRQELIESNVLLEARCKELESALDEILHGSQASDVIAMKALSTPTTDEHLQKLFVEWLGEPVAYSHFNNETGRLAKYDGGPMCSYLASEYYNFPLFAPKKVSN